MKSRSKWSAMFLPVLSLIIASACGGGGDVGSGVFTNEPVEWHISDGGIPDIFVNGLNITEGGSFNGHWYKGSFSLIGSCDGTDDNNNISSFPFGGDVSTIAVGQIIVKNGAMRTFDRSTDCMGPNFKFVYYRPDVMTLRVSIEVGPMPKGNILQLSSALDLIKDEQNAEFRFSRNDFYVYTSGCNGRERRTGFGLFYKDVPKTCNVLPMPVGTALANPKISYTEWRNHRLNVGLRRNIQSSDYQYFVAQNHWGTDDLQHAFDDASRSFAQGEVVRAEEEWKVFYLN